MSAGRRVRVGSLSQLSEDGQRVVAQIDDLEILVVVLCGERFAISNICSHDEVWLDDGTLHPESCEIECPMHEGRFDLRTGAATHLPCERPVPSYPVHVEGDEVFVEIPAAASEA
jgi:anthranilate 1,2-dioxygenase ferredoxin component